MVEEKRMEGRLLDEARQDIANEKKLCWETVRTAHKNNEELAKNMIARLKYLDDLKTP